LQVATSPEKLLTAQILHKKASACIPFGFAKGTSVKNSDQVIIIDVAREVGVSYATNSLVLNNKGNVSLWGAAGKLCCPPFLPARKEVSYLSQ